MARTVMNATLDSLIEEFRAAQDIGVSTLVNALGIPRPSSDLDWLHYCCQNGLHSIDELHGVGIYAHGYGVELKIGSLTIDFDWGENGEPDGFDAWRLWNFRLDNHPEIACSYELARQWLDSASTRVIGKRPWPKETPDPSREFRLLTRP